MSDTEDFTLPEEELSEIIYKYGEERFSRVIAKNICIQRKIKPIETTGELVKIIESENRKKEAKRNHPQKGGDKSEESKRFVFPKQHGDSL